MSSQRNKAQAVYYFSVRNVIKRKQSLLFLKRYATCATDKNNVLKRNATFARAEVAHQIAECPPVDVIT